MKVSFPLSFKVALWLLLNLLLLALAAAVFLVSQGGLSWDSLVAGSSGNRLHALAEVISGEVAAAAPADRDAVLARFSAAYNADIALLRNRGNQVAGTPLSLPRSVRDRLDQGPQGPRGLGRSGRPPQANVMGDDPEAPVPHGGGPALLHADGRGRFLRHEGEPPAWWIGLRVPFHEPGERPLPATLLFHTESFWSIVLLLNLETWLLVGACVLALSVLFWLPLVRGITRDVRALTIATERIAEGRFGTRIASGRRDELGRLGESVNVMAGRLDTLVNGQKRFLADVAHELGSPLARLQVATEILEHRATDAQRDPLQDVREEVEQLATLINELLAFTQSGLRGREVDLVPVEINSLVSRVLEREDKGRRIEAHIDAGLRAMADAPLLDRAIANLVRNALRYAAHGGPIKITAAAEAATVVVAIDDDGPGVPTAALSRLGEPFFRPDVARTRESGGVGLGLAIVRASLLACGGDVRFSNRSPRGFRAELHLPRAP